MRRPTAAPRLCRRLVGVVIGARPRPRTSFDVGGTAETVATCGEMAGMGEIKEGVATKAVAAVVTCARTAGGGRSDSNTQVAAAATGIGTSVTAAAIGHRPAGETAHATGTMIDGEMVRGAAAAAAAAAYAYACPDRFSVWLVACPDVGHHMPDPRARSGSSATTGAAAAAAAAAAAGAGGSPSPCSPVSPAPEPAQDWCEPLQLSLQIDYRCQNR
jgi:hypothetical protein